LFRYFVLPTSAFGIVITIAREFSGWYLIVKSVGRWETFASQVLKIGRGPAFAAAIRIACSQAREPYKSIFLLSMMAVRLERQSHSWVTEAVNIAHTLENITHFKLH